MLHNGLLRRELPQCSVSSRNGKKFQKLLRQIPPPPPQPFYGPFSWTTRVSRCQKRLDFMVQAEINRGIRHTDHPAGRHSIRTNQYSPLPSPIYFYGPDALPAAQPKVSKHWRQLMRSKFFRGQALQNSSSNALRPDINRWLIRPLCSSSDSSSSLESVCNAGQSGVALPRCDSATRWFLPTGIITISISVTTKHNSRHRLVCWSRFSNKLTYLLDTDTARTPIDLTVRPAFHSRDQRLVVTATGRRCSSSSRQLGVQSFSPPPRRRRG